MKIDMSKTTFHEDSGAEAEFNQVEIRRCRLLLRRLRFLEQQIRENGGMSAGNGGGAFAEMEVEALEWLLTEVGYLQERTQ